MSDPKFLLAVLLVVGSGMAHAVWNFLTKKSNDRAVFLLSIMLIASILLIPVFVLEFAELMWSMPRQGYLLMLLSMLLQGGYSFLLSKAYTSGDLSQVYPVMRGTGTFLAALLGVLFLGESLTVWGWLGILIIISGMFVLQNRMPAAVRLRHAKKPPVRAAAQPETAGLPGLKPILLAVTVGACISAYVVVDKMALEYLSPWSLLFVSNLGFMLALVPSVIRSKQWTAEWSRNWRAILCGAVLSPGSYLLFLFAMRLAQVAQLAPIREIGTVFGTLLGIFLLKESNGAKRIAGAGLIAAGIILVSAAG
jgi:drug/metabolite transporter (DMT)-like permease